VKQRLMVVALSSLAIGCGDSEGENHEDGSVADASPDLEDGAIGPDGMVTPAACETEQSVHVAHGGSDDGSCGAELTPCATIGQGLARAQAGDVVCVHTGLYSESWLEVPSDVTMVSADGLLAAVIYSGEASAVRFQDVSNAGMYGFEVYGNWDEGSPGDGLIRVHDAENITIRNTMAHDAPFDMDVVKVSGEVSGLLIEGLVAWNPAHRTGGEYQEVVDIYGSGAEGEEPPPVSNVIVRGCWLFHIDGIGDWLIYSKIYAENILYENNVFGPSAGNGWGNPAVGIGTGEAGIPDPTAAVVTHAIVRNNVFVGLQGDAALAVMNADDTWIYNNTFYANSGSKLRSVVMTRGNSHAVGDTRIFNNIFSSNHPSKDGVGTFFWIRDALPSPWYHDYNLYYDNITASDTPYAGEAGGKYDLDPGLSTPAVPDTSSPNLQRIAEIQAGFAISSTSPARDVGIDAVGISGHPNWSPGQTDRRWDAEKDPRPAADTWDLGADEVE
jgi:hypothetical protein